ncbi:hypothetical protein [Microcystis phage Mae-Yong1326-1]|nr:hypothetical protein [Microcystis phage Mae-Yong1326-1]
MSRLVIPVMGNDQGIAQGMSALAQAMFPDPAQEARALYFAAGARSTAAEAALREGRLAARQRAASIASTGNSGPELMAALLEADMAQQAPEFALGLAAASPDATPEGLAVRQLGARVGYQNTAPGVREGLAQSGRNAAIAAGPGYARVAEERRRFDQDLQTVLAPDGTPTIVPRVQVTAPGANFRPILTENQQQGLVAGRLAAGETVPNADMVLAPGQVVAERGAASRQAATPTTVMREGRLATVRLGDLGVGDVLVPNSDNPYEAGGRAVLAGQNFNPATLAPLAQVEAQRRAAGASRTGAGPAPLDVSPAERNALAAAIQGQVTEMLGGAAPPADLVSQLAEAAATRYQQTRNSADAIEFVMSRVRGLPTQGVGNPFSSNRVVLPEGGLASLFAPPVAPVAPAAPPAVGGAAPAQPAPQAAGALPPAARAQLREGVVVTFANGQAWTLRNGVPTQVR